MVFRVELEGQEMFLVAKNETLAYADDDTPINGYVPKAICYDKDEAHFVEVENDWY